ncbi:putative membrane protein [Lachnellula willkommii]|uniref:Putative membrane protein n=1 Tax=Lachnellula willkommii TaxID=215461 RepID=A0A559MKH0_9HELO|nr:putative membrane protein [Lachnellula willkommii]
MPRFADNAPQFRYRSPFWQNFLSGLTIAFTAGIYVALNLLGAGGGQPDSAQISTRLNACLNSIWVLSSALGSVVLHTVGPGITAFLGVSGYIVYVGGLWHLSNTGKAAFPYFSSVCIGISAGLIFVTSGYIMLSYPEEKEKGLYVTTGFGLLAGGEIIGGIIPLLLSRNNNSDGGVPNAVYIAFIVIMCLIAIAGLFILPPNKITRDDGSGVAAVKYRGLWVELKSNLSDLCDKRLLLMIPCFLPAETYLVYLGSVNAFHNNLRTRCLLSFTSVVLQIPFSIILQKIFDHNAWKRKTRAILGLAYVAVPLCAAWVWEMIRVRSFDRHHAPAPMDWTDDGFAAEFVLFMLNWISSTLWQYVIMYFLGTLTNDPVKGSHYAGGFRACLAAGESVVFGLDSLLIPYAKEAGIIFAFYFAGICIYAYMALFVVEETKYFQEENVVVPTHILEETGRTEVVVATEVEGDSTPEKVSAEGIAKKTGL